MQFLPIHKHAREQSVIVHTAIQHDPHSRNTFVSLIAPVSESEVASPVFWYYPAWLPIFVVGLVAALIVMVLRYRTAYLIKKNEEIRLHRQTHFQSQILAVINHDIQTPLHYLEMSLQQVDRYIKDQATDPVIRDTSNVSYHAVRQIRKLTGDLLLFVKLQMREHKEDIVSEQVDVSEMVDEALEFFQPTIQSKALRVHNDMVPGLTLNTNKNLISVILHNLIDNALKNTVEGQVTIASQRTANAIEITITDTGSGMKRPTADWINSDIAPTSHHDDAGASGIGLAIVKEFCSMLHIRFKVSTNQPKGTIVQLLLPL